MPRKKKVPAVQPDIPREWREVWDNLAPEQQHAIEAESAEIRRSLANGSRLALGKHGAAIRKVLSPGKAVGAKAKSIWSLYLHHYRFGGVSRSSFFAYMDAWEAAESQFNPAFLDAFCAAGFVLSVTPSKKKPLGKYTDYARSVKAAAKQHQLSTDDAHVVVVDVSNRYDEKKQHEKKAKQQEEGAKTLAQKQDEVLLPAHNAVLRAFAKVSRLWAQDGSGALDYESLLCEFTGRLVTAIGVTRDVTIEPKPLSGYVDYPPLVMAEKFPVGTDPQSAKDADGYQPVA